MKNPFKQLLFIFSFITVMSFITGCEHTVQGMKQDVREDTNSDYDTDDQNVTVIKKTEVIYPDQSLPTSPPPLQTPPQ